MSGKQSEKRRYVRKDLSCPVTLLDAKGLESTSLKTVNISDGGALVSIPLDRLPDCDEKLKLSLSVPRSTSNTFMLEDFETEGMVVRHQPLRDDRFAGVALKFAKPVKLGLEV